MLYTRIGNHAKSEGISNLTMALAGNSSGLANVYDINFTAIATYVEIEEFITDIEDDSKLGFKIENFRMVPSSENGNVVQATFTCKNITVTGISSSSATITDTTGTTRTITNSGNNTVE